MENSGAQWPDPAQPIGPPATPPPWQAPPVPPPAPKSHTKLIAVIATVGLLAVACAGSVAFGAIKALRDTPATPTAPAAPRALSEAGPSASSVPTSAAPARPVGVTGKVPAGSKASSLKVRKSEDLERVCDRWYYPKSPKYTTAVAPHPIVVSVRDRKDLDFRTTKSYLGIPYDAPEAIKAAWEGKNPAKVQLVACVDLVTIGSKVKSCKIDKPKKSSIPMKEGTYRLSLYEAATRRKIFETKLVGEDETCPIFIIIGNDRSVYSGLEDRQLVDALQRYVEQ
ncbi:hypothetical protein [Actinoplanes friuliensis]|uniref:Uncharacterized protein n=1 Tax=Actinoplanes friuliensis DSM 7358 TaxID=1246995 RepID=U5WCC2_9ACTN|nr:hypothetical protein [Actinoplanes friuliensis]AGZ46617.1 hypothetical protein AFR_41815 [Actinoplanes friuliensis DSM 7358]